MAKQLSKKDVTITGLTKEMSNLVNIINKIVDKNHATTNKNTHTGKISFDRSRAKSPVDTQFDPNGYYWTHGYNVH